MSENMRQAVNRLPNVTTDASSVKGGQRGGVQNNSAGQTGKGVESAMQWPDEVTTQQAANMLNVSRPYVIKLIDSGVLRARLVGKHRRLLRSEVGEYAKEAYKRAEQSCDKASLMAEAENAAKGTNPLD